MGHVGQWVTESDPLTHVTHPKMVTHLTHDSWPVDPFLSICGWWCVQVYIVGRLVVQTAVNAKKISTQRHTRADVSLSTPANNVKPVRAFTVVSFPLLPSFISNHWTNMLPKMLFLVRLESSISCVIAEKFLTLVRILPSWWRVLNLQADGQSFTDFQVFLKFTRGVYPYLPMVTNAPWSIFLFLGGEQTSLILNFNIQKCEFCAQIQINNLQFTVSEIWFWCF